MDGEHVNRNARSIASFYRGWELLNEHLVETIVALSCEQLAPRQPSEHTFALESSWSVVQDCLDRWTPEMLEVEFPRELPDKIQLHARQSVLIRLITHDSAHCGE